jgi:hypothetical protein
MKPKESRACDPGEQCAHRQWGGEIGRICGVDRKTVAARRAKIPQSGEMGNLDSRLDVRTGHYQAGRSKYRVKVRQHLRRWSG